MNKDHPLRDLAPSPCGYDWELNLLLPEFECVHGALPNEADKAPCDCFKYLRARVAA